MGQGVAKVNRVHPPTDGWSLLGQGTKTPTLGYSHPPPPHNKGTAQPPPMPESFFKRKPGRVHRAVGIFLSVYLFVYFSVYLFQCYIHLSVCWSA